LHCFVILRPGGFYRDEGSFLILRVSRFSLFDFRFSSFPVPLWQRVFIRRGWMFGYFFDASAAPCVGSFSFFF
jgi:hypothetical protein